MNERELKRRAKKFLNTILQGKWVSYNPYPNGEAGTPDYIGCLNGHAVMIEFKGEGGKLRPVQRIRIRQWESVGATVLVIYSMEELKCQIKRLLKREK